MTEQAIRYTARTAAAIKKADEQLPVAIDLTPKKPNVINNYYEESTTGGMEYPTGGRRGMYLSWGESVEMEPFWDILRWDDQT